MSKRHEFLAFPVTALHGEMGAGEKEQAPPRGVALTVKATVTVWSLGRQQDGSRGSSWSLGAGAESMG